MGHLGESVAGWEWDSVLLLANPAFDTIPLQSHEPSASFAVGQSWTALESLQENSPSLSDGKAAAGPQSSSSMEKTTTSDYELFRDPRLDSPIFWRGESRVLVRMRTTMREEAAARGRRCPLVAKSRLAELICPVLKDIISDTVSVCSVRTRLP